MFHDVINVVVITFQNRSYLLNNFRIIMLSGGNDDEFITNSSRYDCYKRVCEIPRHLEEKQYFVSALTIKQRCVSNVYIKLL